MWVTANGLAPRYLKIAEDLREQIRSGRLEPGVKLPSEAELADAYEVNRTTVRSALQLLASEGLIDRRRGTPCTVRVPLPRVVWDGGRFQYEKDMVPLGGLPRDTHLAHDADQAHETAEVDLVDDEIFRAGVDLARALEVAEWTRIHRYTYLISLDGRPTRIAHHYYTEDLARRITESIPQPEVEPGRALWKGGFFYQLAQLQLEPDEAHVRVRTRMPMPEEAEVLSIPEGVSVMLLRVRSRDTFGTVREVKDVIARGDTTDVTFTMRLRRWPGGAPGPELEEGL